MTEPQAYSIGYVPFVGVEIFLDSHPLIPRTETEYWVNQAINNEVSKMPFDIKMLDLCAGSGCIGLAVLDKVPETKVDFVEIDERHHETIKKNLNANSIKLERARVLGGDLFENIPEGSKYNFILTNPPYVDPKMSLRVEKSVMEHEPGQAIWGGKKGMEIIERIIKESPEYLEAHGVLYIEHEPEQVEAIQALSKQYGYTQYEAFKDQYGVERYSRLDLR